MKRVRVTSPLNQKERYKEIPLANQSDVLQGDVSMHADEVVQREGGVKDGGKEGVVKEGAV